MITIRVGRRGQITIPRYIRRLISIKEGDHIALLPQGDHVVMHPITKTLLDLRGSVPVHSPQDFSAIRQQVMDDRVKRNSESEA